MIELLKSFLQGKWLGHPLHPALVHLPTALFPGALIFDLLSRFTRDDSGAFAATSFWCIVIGLLSVLMAAPTGLADWAEIKREKPAWKIGLIHMVLNVVVAVIFLASLVIRLRQREETIVGVVPLALSIAGTAILLYAGWLGGRMVYQHGIAVARMSKDQWRRAAEAGGANLPAKQQGGD